MFVRDLLFCKFAAFFSFTETGITNRKNMCSAGLTLFCTIERLICIHLFQNANYIAKKSECEITRKSFLCRMFFQPPEIDMDTSELYNDISLQANFAKYFLIIFVSAFPLFTVSSISLLFSVHFWITLPINQSQHPSERCCRVI